MLSKIRIIFLSVLLGIFAAHLPQIRNFYTHILDEFDNRPGMSILFIGNSRTYYNDMPQMVRKIADSAHSAKKYEITMYAPPGVSFEQHWNDPAVHELLKRKWDYVVLQGGSSDQVNETTNARFLTYGAKLVGAIKETGSEPVLLVAWRCTEAYYDHYPDLKKIGPVMHYARIQASYDELAQTTGASSVNVGRVWEKLSDSSPQPLTVDGNHPTMRGSYLIALMFYHFFSNDDLENVTYIPAGVTADDAAILKTAAQRW